MSMRPCFGDDRTVPRRCITPLGRPKAALFFRKSLSGGAFDLRRPLRLALGAAALRHRGLEAFDEDKADAAGERAGG